MSAPNLISPTTLSGGTPVGGTGTTNTIPRWTGASTLGDSLLTQSGATITQTGSVNGAVAFNVTNQNTGASAYSAVEIDSAGASWRLKSIRTAGMFAIERNGVVAVQIDNVLNVGIGTASPTSTTDIWGLQANTGATSASAPTGTMRVAYAGAAAAGNFGSSVVFTQRWASANAQQVAVGQIAGVKIAGDGFYGGGLAFFTSNGSGNDLAERARIDSAGNFGIGTASPQVRAHVYAANVAGKGQIMVDSPAGDISQITFYNAGTTANGALYANTSGMVLGTSSSGSLSFQQNGGTAWQIIAGRHLVAGADNTYDIGASGATRPRTVYVGTSFDASASGAGLKLPATPGNTDPNTLDCYADGGTANSGGVTWTPTINFGGASTGITYSVQTGRYTRIGNMVFAYGYIVLTSKGTATGNAYIGGLPTASNTTNMFVAATIGYLVNVTFASQPVGYIAPNQTSIALSQNVSGGGNAPLTDASFANTSQIMFSIAYPVT